MNIDQRRWHSTVAVAALTVMMLQYHYSDARNATSSVKQWQTLPMPPALPAELQTGDVLSSNIRIHYSMIGVGEPLVLLHGGLGDSSQWGFQVAALAQRYQIILIDSRGQGESQPTTQGISYGQMADDVVEVLNALQIKRAAIVGWSDGGIIALHVALRQPAMVAGLYVLGTNYSLGGMKRASLQGRPETVRRYYQRCAERTRSLGVTRKDSDAVRQALGVMWRSEPTFEDKEIATIAAPAIIALGVHDELITRSHATKMAKLIAASELALLPNASHFALWQTPDAVTQSIVRLMQRAFPTPAASHPTFRQTEQTTIPRPQSP
jgi:pimeloyl-ACP methyl ester carboxylesterase